MKSPIYTILLSKSDFSFALLLATFEPLDIQQSYIPLLKALMCGIIAVGAQGSGCMFTFCHAPLKAAVLLQKWQRYHIHFRKLYYYPQESFISTFVVQICARLKLLYF